MLQEKAAVLANRPIARDTFEMKIQTRIAPECEPGQFIQIRVPGYYLRRPISIAWIEAGTLTIIYKIAGDGTRRLARLQPGELIDIFGPLGSGFPIEERNVTLIGGGVGVPPLLETARQYRARNHKVQAVLGFQSRQDVFGVEVLHDLGCEVFVATMDGSLGIQGTVLDAVNEHSVSMEFIEACGPLPMLRALNEAYSCGYISLEARMACGIGACMGCVVQGADGQSLRVCKDGPVFKLKEVRL